MIRNSMNIVYSVHIKAMFIVSVLTFFQNKYMIWMIRLTTNVLKRCEVTSTAWWPVVGWCMSNAETHIYCRDHASNLLFKSCLRWKQNVYEGVKNPFIHIHQQS